MSGSFKFVVATMIAGGLCHAGQFKCKDVFKAASNGELAFRIGNSWASCSSKGGWVKKANDIVGTISADTRQTSSELIAYSDALQPTPLAVVSRDAVARALLRECQLFSDTNTAKLQEQLLRLISLAAYFSPSLEPARTERVRTLQNELFRLACEGPWLTLLQLRPQFSNTDTELLYPAALQRLLVAAFEKSDEINELRDVCPRLTDGNARDACATRAKNLETRQKLAELREKNIDWEVLENYESVFKDTTYWMEYRSLLHSKLESCARFCSDPQKLERVCAALDPGTAKEACATNWCQRSRLKATRDYEAGAFAFETGDMYTLACRGTPYERDAEILDWRFAAQTAYLRWQEGDRKSAEGRPHGYSKQAWITLMDALKKSASERFSRDLEDIAPDVFRGISASYGEAETTSKNMASDVFAQWSNASAHRPSMASDPQWKQNWTNWSLRLLDEAQYALSLDRDEQALPELVQQILRARQELTNQPPIETASVRSLDWCGVAVDPIVTTLMNFIPYLPVRIPLAIGWNYVRRSNSCPI